MKVGIAELAGRVGARVYGDGGILVDRVAALDSASPGAISFLSDQRQLASLQSTQASAVIIREEHLSSCPVAGLVVDDPYLAFARIAGFLHPSPAAQGGVHPSAVVHSEAQVDATAQVGAGAIVDAGARICAGVLVGPGSVVGADAQVGVDSRLVANVTIGDGCRIGRRVVIQPGAVIGGDGFGFARDADRWVRIPQLGRVIIGDDVDIGANTTIDRGTLADTVIEDGVKLDNLIQVAHNVHIGRDTAAAACVGISGSVTIGARCMLAGGVGIAGHLALGDDVTVTGMSMVTRSLPDAGVYSSGLGARPNREWNRTVARLHRLDRLDAKVRALRAAPEEETE